MSLPNKKILPLGMDDFRLLRTSKKESYYIDKTLMIKDFLDYSNYVTLITRPRRFGKTLNMTMIRDFFDITQKSQEIFEGLAIMDTEYASEINRVPVISLSLKGCQGDTLENLKASLASEIRKEYVKYETIFKNVDQSIFTYEIFFKILKGLKSKTWDDLDLQNSLAYLLEALFTFYNVRPILLIDEYDNPIIEAHTQGFRREFTSFYGTFLTMALKGNPHLGQALLTGIQRVAKESIFSKLNNVVIYNVLDEKYAPYFGLSSEETAALLSHYDLTLTEEVKKRYNGYVFGGLEMYNPWSILSYANKKKLQNFWLKTSTNALIKECVLDADQEFYESFDTLIERGEADITLNLEASFAELPRADTLWGLLVNAGYLTVIHEDYDFYSFIVRIPNEEIKAEFQEIVGSYTNLSSQKLKNMLRALINGNITDFLKIYQELVIHSTSYYDARENAYHMLMLGMVMNLSDIYEISSNIESGHGRADLIMKSKDVKRPHIIIEFKQGEALEMLAQDALKQIKDNEYYSGLSGEVLCLGIAHFKKKCKLVSELIHL